MSDDTVCVEVKVTGISLKLSVVDPQIYEGQSARFHIDANVNPPFDLYINGKYSGSVKTTDFELNFPSEGTYTVYVMYGGKKSNEVSVKVVGVVLTLYADKTEINEGDSVTFSLDSNLGCSGEILIDGNVKGNFNECNFSYTFSDEGVYSVAVRVQDVLSNTITIDVYAPVEGGEEGEGEGEEEGGKEERKVKRIIIRLRKWWERRHGGGVE